MNIANEVRANNLPDTYLKCELLSIDAWRDDMGWTWNAWYSLEKDIYIAETETTPRKVFAMLRKWGFLSNESKGRVQLDDDGYNLVIEDRNTGEPILALCYGAED
jgi:hypothetical protein